jgi:hypothetical protein
MIEVWVDVVVEAEIFCLPFEFDSHHYTWHFSAKTRAYY